MHGHRPHSRGSSGARTSASRTLAPAASLHPPAPLDLRRAPVRPSETDLSSDRGDWAKRGFHWSECAVGGPRRSCAQGRERSVSLSCPTNRSNLRAMPYLRKMMGATAIGLGAIVVGFSPERPGGQAPPRRTLSRGWMGVATPFLLRMRARAREDELGVSRGQRSRSQAPASGGARGGWVAPHPCHRHSPLLSHLRIPLMREKGSIGSK